MTLVELLIFLLTSYGVYFVLVQSGVPGWAQLRDKLAGKYNTVFELLQCPICSGFWSSVITSTLFALYRGETVVSVRTVLLVVLHGFAGAAWVYFVEAYIRRLEAR